MLPGEESREYRLHGGVPAPSEDDSLALAACCPCYMSKAHLERVVRQSRTLSATRERMRLMSERAAKTWKRVVLHTALRSAAGVLKKLLPMSAQRRRAAARQKKVSRYSELDVRSRRQQEKLALSRSSTSMAAALKVDPRLVSSVERLAMHGMVQKRMWAMVHVVRTGAPLQMDRSPLDCAGKLRAMCPFSPEDAMELVNQVWGLGGEAKSEQSLRSLGLLGALEAVLQEFRAATAFFSEQLKCSFLGMAGGLAIERYPWPGVPGEMEPLVNAAADEAALAIVKRRRSSAGVVCKPAMWSALLSAAKREIVAVLRSDPDLSELSWP